jgi:hypothetical protein
MPQIKRQLLIILKKHQQLPPVGGESHQPQPNTLGSKKKCDKRPNFYHAFNPDNLVMGLFIFINDLR